MTGMQVTPAFRVEDEAGSEYHPSSCVALSQEYKEKQEFEKQKAGEDSELLVGKLLRIDVGDKFAGLTFYNPSGEVEINGKTCICIRAEPSKTCRGSKVFLLEKCADEVWRPVMNSPVLPLEDGFCVPIDPETTIMAGVKAYPNPTAEHPDKIDYYMVFYLVYHSGEEFAVREFTRGPNNMKGIRFVLLKHGKVGVFTRPQGLQPDGSDRGLGKIAYIELESLDDMTPENLLKARVIENQFAQGDWGGVNQPFLLPDGRIGVLGHIAYRDGEGNRHYYVMAFIYDPQTHQATPIKIIASSEDFPDSEAKFPDLRGVIYPGGMVFNDDGTITVKAGLRDMFAVEIKTFHPFKQGESMTNDAVLICR